jgi:hypothetical protein
MADEQAPPVPPPRPEFLPLPEVLDALYDFYRVSTMQLFGQLESEAQVDLDRSMADVSGTSLALGAVPQHPDSLLPSDVGQLALSSAMYPHLTSSELAFRLGHHLPRGVTEVSTPAEKLMAFLTVDCHRLARGLLFEAGHVLHDSWGHMDFPRTISVVHAVFESPAGAKSYFRRGWRFLSENFPPALPARGQLTLNQFWNQVDHAAAVVLLLFC